MTRSAFFTAFALAGLLVTGVPVGAQSSAFSVGDVAIQRYSTKQLENLVAPVALYPDALLAQVLIAATFPDQVEEAAEYVRLNGTALIDEQEWDISVRSVAHYPSAINMMADKIDWTATLGRAYAFQSSEVMAAVQRMRAMAAEQGNLVSTEQQQVIHEQGNYIIVPAQPRAIYVPVYDPVVIYTRPVFSVGFSTRYWSFGVGFPIGSWLMYDLDWRVRRVYYNGWADGYITWAGGWRVRSRPFIQITNIYVNPRYQNVYVNRGVTRRVINYSNVDRYGRVHRDTWFGDRREVTRTAQPRSLPPVATPKGYTRDGSGQATGRTDNIGRSVGGQGSAAGSGARSDAGSRSNTTGRSGTSSGSRAGSSGRQGSGRAGGASASPPNGAQKGSGSGAVAKPRTAGPGEARPPVITPPQAVVQPPIGKKLTVTPPAAQSASPQRSAPPAARSTGAQRSAPPTARSGASPVRSTPPAAKSSGTQRSAPPSGAARKAQKRTN